MMKTQAISRQWVKIVPLVGLFVALLCLDISVMMLYKLVELKSVHAVTKLQYYLSVLHQPWLYMGLGLSALQLWVWTRILARTDLSIAYPFSSLSYPLTMLAAVLFYHEFLPIKVWIGAIFISVGVSIIGSRTGHG